jgi:hypothetical protein
MRVSSGSWEGEKVFLRDQVLEIRLANDDNRLHVARKTKAPDDWDLSYEAMSSSMTETALQPDVTRLQPATGFSSSRDRVRIHRGQEMRTVPAAASRQSNPTRCA